MPKASATPAPPAAIAQARSQPVTVAQVKAANAKSRKKTWAQKFENGRTPEVVKLDKAMLGVPAGAKLLISTPIEIDAYIRAIPSGETRTVHTLRADLAQRHKADTTCPMTTGIFARIVAEKALEDLAAGQKETDVAPFWRLIDPASPLAKKLSCGPDYIAHRRTVERG